MYVIESREKLIWAFLAKKHNFSPLEPVTVTLKENKKEALFSWEN